MSGTVRVGVIGCGRIGRLHAENLARLVPGAELVAVADPLASAVQEVAAACRCWPTELAEDSRASLGLRVLPPGARKRKLTRGSLDCRPARAHLGMATCGSALLHPGEEVNRS